MTTPDRSLTELVRGCRAGDRAALDRLTERLYPRVEESVHRELARDFRRHHAWLLPLFSTGDIVQEVFTSVLGSLDDFEPRDEDSFARLLTTLVKNRLVDALRHHGAERRDGRRNEPLAEDRAATTATPADGRHRGPDRAVPPGPATLAALGEQIDAFFEVLAEFPERTRLLLQLRIVEKLEFADIAERLGWPSRSACNKAFLEAKARLLLRLRQRGVAAPGAASTTPRSSESGR